MDMELKANELRIGNYFIENGDIHQVTTFDITNLVNCEHHKVVSDMKSIPLNKGNLYGIFNLKPNKFNIYSFSNDKVSVSIRFLKDGSNHISIDSNDDESYFRDLVTEIHTFQNLIYALTQEEITIK